MAISFLFLHNMYNLYFAELCSLSETLTTDMCTLTCCCKELLFCIYSIPASPFPIRIYSHTLTWIRVIILLKKYYFEREVLFSAEQFPGPAPYTSACPQTTGTVNSLLKVWMLQNKFPKCPNPVNSEFPPPFTFPLQVFIWLICLNYLHCSFCVIKGK